MSVAEAFARIDAGAMIDNALARVRRNAGVRALKPTTSVRDYLEALGLNDKDTVDMKIQTPLAANDTAPDACWHSSTVSRRYARRERRALRG